MFRGSYPFLILLAALSSGCGNNLMDMFPPRAPQVGMNFPSSSTFPSTSGAASAYTCPSAPNIVPGPQSSPGYALDSGQFTACAGTGGGNSYTISGTTFYSGSTGICIFALNYSSSTGVASPVPFTTTSSSGTTTATSYYSCVSFTALPTCPTSSSCAITTLPANANALVIIDNSNADVSSLNLAITTGNMNLMPSHYSSGLLY